MEQIFYGADRIVEIMQTESKGWLFYVAHNTMELFEEFVEYCADNQLDITSERSAEFFLDYRDMKSLL